VIEALPAELWFAYARARRLRTASGEWPEPVAVHRCAAVADADPWALLVLTRGELPELDPSRRLTGGLAAVDDLSRYARPLVLAPTPDALLALRLAETLYCEVVDPWGRRVDRRWLERAASDWSEPLVPGSQLAPEAIAMPPLPLEQEH